MIRVMHIINNVSGGGAQAMLAKLLRNIDTQQFQSAVVVLNDLNREQGRQISDDVAVFYLGMTQGNPLSLWRAGKIFGHVRKWKPDLLQGWMYHGNLAASFASAISWRGIPVLWNVRHSVHDFSLERRSTQLAIRLGAKFSCSTSAIINNSHVSDQQHIRLGFDETKSRVIGNGFETASFAPVEGAKKALCQELGIDHSSRLICMIARYHPQKAHDDLLVAASGIIERYPDVHFVLAGKSIDRQNVDLSGRLQRLGLSSRVHLLGRRTDVTSIYSASCMSVLPSAYGEGFPNVLGESMLCETPCVATDVGDSRHIVADFGRLAPPGDASQLEQAMSELLELSPKSIEALGKSARESIMERYSIDRVVSEYESLYCSMFH